MSAPNCFPATWYRPLHTTAKEITGALGEVRDRDVLLEFLVAERKSAPASDAPGIDRLIARVDAERERARAKMIRFLGSVESHGVEKAAERRFGKGAKAPKPPGDRG